jgi:hypothetical protein
VSGIAILNDGDNHTVTAFTDPHTRVFQTARYWDCEAGEIDFLPSLRMGMVVVVPGERDKLDGDAVGAWVVCRPHQLSLRIRAGVRVFSKRVSGEDMKRYYRERGPWPMVGVLTKHGSAGNRW